MARKSSGKPWLHGASGWWCATISGKRKKLDKDYKVACRKLKARLTQAKKGDASAREWLDATFGELSDEYLEHIKATKKPASYRAFRYGILRALRIWGTRLRVCEVRKFHLSKIEQEMSKGEYSPTTIKDTITTVQQVFNWAVEQELLDASPVPKYRKPRARRRSRTISPVEFRALLRHSDRHFRRFLIALRLSRTNLIKGMSSRPNRVDSFHTSPFRKSRVTARGWRRPDRVRFRQMRTLIRPYLISCMGCRGMG